MLLRSSQTPLRSREPRTFSRWTPLRSREPRTSPRWPPLRSREPRTSTREPRLRSREPPSSTRWSCPSTRGACPSTHESVRSTRASVSSTKGSSGSPRWASCSLACRHPSASNTRHRRKMHRREGSRTWSRSAHSASRASPSTAYSFATGPSMSPIGVTSGRSDEGTACAMARSSSLTFRRYCCFT